MPLRAHFRSPVNNKHHWNGLYGQWPGEIVRTLFDILPAGFRSAPKVHLGSSFEADVSAYDLHTRDPAGTAAQTALAPTFTVETDLLDQDEYEVRVYDAEHGRRLVAAIELVSPGNKDRPETRELFVGKVAALLQQGVCVTLVDIVTVRRANLYADLLTLMGRVDPQLAPTPPPLYAVTLRTRAGRRTRLDAWFHPLTVGDPLPIVPLWLTPDLRIELPLEAGYQETCRVLGIA